MDVTETDLVASAQSGDTAAFGSLYERYMEQIYRYVYYRVSDRDEAEDLTETIFVKAWEALPRFHSRGATFRAWLYRIARNAVIDRHRTRKVLVPLEHAQDWLDVEASSPEAAAEAAQERATLGVALSQLKPRLREVILHRFINGLSHAETAQVMGLRQGHVRVLQHRALHQMRDLLTEGQVP
jgi:RNA polymerase sigma-70 factor (ECF subfamily)